MDNQRVNLLHISDLHYNKHWDSDQKVIYNAFFQDLRALMVKGMKPDLIVFSGDIVANGDDYENFSLALDKIIEPLLRETDLDESRIFLVPGNHDVQRSAICNEDIAQEGLEARLTDREKLNRFYLSHTNYQYIRQKFNHFIELKECLGNTTLITSDLFFEAHYLRELDIALACVNTAWMSRGGLSGENDRQRLLVPEASIRAALDALPDTKTKILVGHHPLDWLAEYAQEDLRRLLEREFTMYLHGHMHEPISGNVRSTIGHTLVHQSGALYTDRTRYNGYAVIALNPTYGHVQVNLRSFYERRERFDAAIDVVPDGYWYSSAPAKAFFEHLPEPLDTTEVSQWVAQRLRPTLTETLDEGFSDRPVSETFVAPRLSKRTADSSSPESDPIDEYEICPLSELISGKENFLIVAKPQFGKTTLLRQVALGIVRDPSQSETPVAPCVIEFADIKPGRNRFRNHLRAQLPDTADHHFNFDDLLSGGHIALLIDDVDLSDRRRWDTLATFIKQHPKNRYLLTTNSHLLDQFDITTSLDTATPLVTLRMEPFGRKEMRALVERWDFKASTPDKESLLDRLVTDIVNINVPLTPVNGTILLTIFDVHGDFTPINRAVLIETFIETLLEKHSLREAYACPVRLS